MATTYFISKNSNKNKKKKSSSNNDNNINIMERTLLGKLGLELDQRKRLLESSHFLL